MRHDLQITLHIAQQRLEDDGLRLWSSPEEVTEEAFGKGNRLECLRGHVGDHLDDDEEFFVVGTLEK